MIDSEKLQACLRASDCPEAQIPEIIRKSERFFPESAKLLNDWIEHGEVGEFSLHGITPQWLRDNKNMADIGILISYDWLLREGETAAAALRAPLR
ncbi:MAG: hypothetical protein LBK56_04625 [Gracilibacteraceae bacterium]|nr:hypothetical protein [Gracilibacteraceae bacterium]